MKKSFWGVVMLLLGIMLLFKGMGFAYFDWFFNFSWVKYLLPIVMIIAGLKMIAGVGRCDGKEGKGGGHECNVADVINEDARLDISSAFVRSTYNMNGERFCGAEVSTFMGGVTLNLYDAVISQDCDLHLKTFMGAIVLIVPHDVKVSLSSSCVFGGVDNTTVQCGNADAKVLHVRVECFMGGVEVKYHDQ